VNRKQNLALWLGAVLSLSPVALAADGNPAEAPAATITTQSDKNLSNDAIAQLRAQLAAQQKQIEQLKQALEAQQKMLDGAPNTAPVMASAPAAAPLNATAPADTNEERNVSPYKSLGQVASTTPVIPVGSAPVSSLQKPPATDEAVPGPMQLRLGNAFIVPVGFMDMTSITRSENAGTGIGTNFGSIPYGNTQAGSLTESRLSVQNSRIGMRIDTGFKDVGIIGYWESDFLGQTGNPPNGSIAISSNPYVFRLRLFFVDVTKNKFEFLAGQSWSLLTPGRKGISPMPGDLFYSQDIDVNYQAGLVWGRIPGFRATYHFSDKAAFAVALENSEPYVGGGNGGSADVLPALVGTANAVSGAVLGGQINNGSSTLSSAALFPDVIAKLAFDPTSRFHLEIAGVEIANKFSNPASTPAYATNTKVGGGGSVNLNFGITNNFRIFTNNYWSDGGGRYIFGQAPDFIIGGTGQLSLVHSASTVSGFELGAGKTTFYGYYGGVYIGKNLAVDTTGKLIGYGPISSDGQNRTIQEVTFGTNTVLARDPKWGALNLMFQFSYLQRNPWLVVNTATSMPPTNAHLEMGFVNLRYTLPASATARTGFGAK
jgi:hypothetical protein